MGSGQSDSPSKYGGIVIQTDQPYCVSGEAISGNIAIQINIPFPARKLNIELKGKEKCKWTETRTRTVGSGEHARTETYYVYHNNDHEILKFEETLYEFDGNEIPAGQYMFPYSFVLPQNCPSSAYFTGSGGAVGYIKYEVKASFKALDGTPIKDIKGKCHLVVRQMAPGANFNVKADKFMNVKK